MAEKDSVQIKKRLSQELPQYKFSVSRNDFAGGHSVNVKVLSGPIDVFANDNDRDRQNGYIEIWRDRYKDDERINDEIKPDIDKMYKIIYDIGEFPSGYHGGPYLHWNFGSYSQPYQVVGPKKPSPQDNPRTEKESKETNAEAELLKYFPQGWKLFKTTINKRGTDGKPLTLVVYNLNKTKDLKNIPYDKFLEFKGEMLTNVNMKWGKFQKFEKWTYPPDTDVLKVIIEKYYGVGEDKKEETPTPQPTPEKKMSVKELANALMTSDSIAWDMFEIESGSQLYSDNELQKKYINWWIDNIEKDAPVTKQARELNRSEKNELGDYIENDNYHSLKNLLMLYGYFGSENKKSAQEYYEKSKYGLNPKNFVQDEFKVGDKFIMTRTSQTFTIDFMVDDNYGIVYFDGLTGNLTKGDLKRGLDSGYYKRVLDEEVEEQMPFKEGDKFLVTINSGDTTLTIIDIDIDSVKVKYADGSIGMFEINSAKSRVERGVWKKVIDEEVESGNEEDIKKAIAALEILALDGDEEAKKGIEALKILLN